MRAPSEIDIEALFRDYLSSDPSLSTYFTDCLTALVILGSHKGIEFGGYYQTKWEQNLVNPLQFSELYFEDFERKKLYVLMATVIDEEMEHFYKKMYEVAGLPVPSNAAKFRSAKLIRSKGKDF